MTQIQHGAQTLRRHPRALWSLVASALAIALIAAFIVAGRASATEELNKWLCDEPTVPSLIADGYTCTKLWNKGQGAGNEQVGELYFKRDGDNLILVTELFGSLSDSDHSETKLCVDDDTNPVVAGTSCTGGTAFLKINEGQTLKPADQAPEEGGNRYEVMIQNLGQDALVDGRALYNVFVNGYTEFSLHFNQGAFSIEAFFQAERNTALTIAKTPNNGTIAIGDKVSFDITISDQADGVDAINATITDELPGDRDWAIVSQGAGTTPPAPPGAGTACTLTDSSDADDDVDNLSCTFATLADGTSYSLTVETAAAVTSDDCDTTFNNTAFADADNADQVQDSGAVTVQCAAIEVNKFAKNATTHDDPDDTVPVAGAGFTLLSGDPLAAVSGQEFTNSSGVACFDGLPLNTSFTLRETTTPSGYATVDDQTVTSSAGASSCGDGDEASYDVENVPLTDLLVRVEAQVDDGTHSSIACVDTKGTPETDDDEVIGSAQLGDPAEVDENGLEPGTYVCTIVIDP